MRQEHCKWYTDDWAAVAAKLQSQASTEATPRHAHQSRTACDWVVVATELQKQPSSQATQRPAHRIQTPSSWHIGTLVGQQDSQNDWQETDLSLDFLGTSAAPVLGFHNFCAPRPDGSREVTRELSLDTNMSPTPSQHLSLSLDRIEPAQQERGNSQQRDVQQERNGSVRKGN